MRLNIQLTFNVASTIAAYGFLRMLNARQPPPGGAIENRRGGVIENRGGGATENRRGRVMDNRGGGLVENGRGGVIENRGGGGATEKQKDNSSNK